MNRLLVVIGLGLVFALGACGGNEPPSSNAGDDVEALAGDTVELDGKSSADTDGDALTYAWQIVSSPEGSEATLVNGDTASPTLLTDAPGEYEVNLAVNDGDSDSGLDLVVVTARPWFAKVTEAAKVPGGGPQKYVDGYGPGAAWGDYDNDGDLDLYVGADGPNMLYRNDGQGVFADVTAQAGVAADCNTYGVAWADYDNDARLDLYIVCHSEDQEADLEHRAHEPNLLYRNNGDGTFTDVASQAGVDVVSHGAGASWMDYDQDGHLDLYVANFGIADFVNGLGMPDGNFLFRNNGDGTFSDVTEKAGVRGVEGPVDFGAYYDLSQPAVSAGHTFVGLWLDYDNDGDADLLECNDMGVSPLYRNNGDGTFSDVTDAAGLRRRGSCMGVSAGDYDRDGFLDIYWTNFDENFLWHSNGNGTFTEIGEQAGVADPLVGWATEFVDFDNDGLLDIYVLNGLTGPPVEETGDEWSKPRFEPNFLYRNNGDGTFIDVTALAGFGDEAVGRGAAVADYDDDGDLDFYVVNADGPNILYRNDIGNRNNWIKIGLLGTESNLKGIGARVEVTTPDLATRIISPAAGSGYLGQGSTDLIIGLGTSGRADVKVRWPSGFVQDFWGARSNELIAAREGALEGSCPLVFAWNGSTYAYVSDVLGSAVTGFFLGPDTYRFPIDTDEYLKIDGLAPRDGFYSIQIVEKLNEIIYLDNAELLVVDHPAGVDVFPNERLALFPPFPDYGLHVVSDARPPVAAFDGDGNDILSRIAEKDGIYHDGFSPLPYEGYAEQHSVVLDLGDLSDAEKIILLLDGWTYYVTSSGLVNAGAAGLGPMLPQLEVIDENGAWETVTMDMGFPAGQPKTMTYDLTGGFPMDDFRVRITTNLQVYLDRILVSTYADKPALRITELPTASGDLHWKGYPKLLTPSGDRRVTPADYDYDILESETVRWVIPEGDYTKYGEVAPLLAAVDDMYVIMHTGDELTLDFDSRGLPELPQGWDRSLILFMDGFLKYIDPYVAHSSSVEPLPFHSMSGYPYPPSESFPTDEEHRRYLDEYNTR